jgi:putative effector of murein hydrolase
MIASLAALWTGLSTAPITWLTATLIAYLIGERISLALGRHPLGNPVLHATWMLGLLLEFTGTPYPTYMAGAQFVLFMLGPATVALALPLYENREKVLRSLVPITAALIVGSVATVASVVATAWVFGLPDLVMVSSLPKSTTSGVAMGIAQATGGDPALAAIIVVFTGIVGAIMATPLLNLLGVGDGRARGFATGLAAHGVGTARAFQVHPLNGTFSGLAMGLNGVMTAVLVPLTLALLGS